MFEMGLAGGSGRKINAVLAGVAALLVALTLSATAKADAFGQLAAFGEAGTGAGQYRGVGPIAIDSDDQTTGGGYAIWVADNDIANSTLRLRKLAPDGTILGSVGIPTSENAGSGDAYIGGIAVDHAGGRVYVLIAALGVSPDRPSLGAAYRIRAYDITPSGPDIVEATGTGITNGVLYDWTTQSSDYVLAADGLAVDASSTPHKLVVVGLSNNIQPALQYIGEDGVASAPVEVLVDEFAAAAGYRPAGLAVGPEGSVYIPVATPEGDGGALIYSVPSGGGTGTLVARDPAANAPSVLSGWGDAGAANGGGWGGPIAISPDGATVYLNEHHDFLNNATVRGFSTADGSMVVRYGGGTESCRITDAQVPFGVAAGPGGIVVTATPGPGYSDGDPSTTLIHVFGPGGSGCPRPSESFKINTKDDDLVTVLKGDTVHFDASASDLLGNAPSSVAWDFDGNDTFETTAPDAALTYDQPFAHAGTFTVGLKISMGPGGDDPTVVHKTVKVVAGVPTAAFTMSTNKPAAGGTVTFDATNSIDPQGSGSGGPTNQLANYHWDFGDGIVQDTTTKTVTHAFANPGAAAITRTVKLTVTGAESGTSAPATQPLTVQGTPVVTTQANTTPTPTTTTTTATTPPGPPPTVTFPKVVLPKSVSVDAKGTTAIKVTCPAGGAACTGKVVLTIKVKQKVKGKTKTVTVKLGTASFNVAPGKSTSVKVKLSSAGKSLLRKSKKLKASAALTLTAGGKSGSTNLSLTLTAAKAKKSRV